jgi:hypothetical protein
MADEDHPEAWASPPAKLGILGWTSAAVLAIGLVSRSTPLFGSETRLFRQFPTEDGYLMLTIARNMALGLGMSTANGTMPTNGTQPLMTAIYSQGFAWFDSDRVSGVAFALAIQVGLAVLGAFLLYSLSTRVLEGHPACREVSLLATAAWFSNGHSVKHSMNCLETGAFAAAVLLFVLALLAASDPLADWSKRRSLGLGALLGLALWVRLDAVFLVLAACLVRFLMAPNCTLRPSLARLTSAVLMGATAVLIISPWLIHNQIHFGSIMPISGRAEASFGSFGSSLSRLPVALAEYVMVVIPVPARFDDLILVRAAAAVVIGGAAWLCVRVWRGAGLRGRALTLLVVLYAVGVCVYYGAFFGAPYFLSRYTFPLAAFAALLWAVTLYKLVGLSQRRWASVAAASALLALVAAANLRVYRLGCDHMHFQVVEWIEEHVDDSTWVGAVQTGTIGFFHDRSINLDGKVNPTAHAAVRVNRIPEYLIELPIEFLADWFGIVKWAELPAIAGHFDVIVADPKANLGVLKRRGVQ